ncbi:MAG: ABC transporter permease subunit [Rhodospirillum sp.]|nr:ABC transporter permease subunit [Rhodospirillum sp.]MCF8488499.1 ABC transporter permease subunit [Rhodospirillum sp.]MCF8503117.1 ABC transporter permease subunit [Rhodospirillum sp.]
MRLINRKPSRRWAVVLALLPFLALVLAYMAGSAARLAENPADKLLPALTKVAESAVRLATEQDKRSGDVLLWADTGASLVRLGMGMGFSVALGLAVGMLTGLLPHARAGLSPFVATLSLIPPLAILPILLIVFGLGEVSKVALIVVGIAPVLVRDMSQRAMEVPPEQVVKAQTLGASSWVLAVRVVLPQVLPRLIQATRLALGPAWLFLIAAEAIAATEGLGYRIFLVRRYLAMDVILPYVLWITLLAFCLDWGLRTLSRKAFPWSLTEPGGDAP